MSGEPPVLIDLDGTLVDSVYLHVVTWDAALREHGRPVPMWRIHAGIGMGSDRLLPWLFGEQVDGAAEMSASHRRRFLDRAGDLRPTNGALALLDDLERREVPFVISTSAGTEVREALLETLGRTDLDTADAGDVTSSKPAPHLLVRSAEEVPDEPHRSTLVGDSPWDAEAARRLDMRVIAVRCGGFGDAELTRAGAAAVVDDPRALVGRL